MKKILFLLMIMVGFTSIIFAQEKFTISGSVKDKSTGEELIGASIRVLELPTVGIRTNEYGFYSLTLPKGKYTLKATYIGYEEFLQTIDLNKNQKINWEISRKGREIKEVKISAKKANENLTQTTMGIEKINMTEIAKLPVLLGEKDILKTIQLLPGVKSAGEGNSGFFVRGGAADQNLILLDEAPVYNASHLLGFFSTFNSDAIKDATLIKGNSPAQYGGRLASVLDVKMNEGNDKDYHVAGGIGLISSRLSLEGPIQKEKSSFLITGRRTYADVFLQASDKFKDNKLYFYDFNAKANYRINKNNRLFLSGYLGRDVLGFGSQFGIDWGNKTATLRWNSILSPKVFSNTSLIYSDYNYKISIKGGAVKFNINSEIQDWNLKQEFQYYRNAKNSWRFGINVIRHKLTPSRFEGDAAVFNASNKVGRLSLENALYANNTYTVNDKLSIDYGVRLTSFSILGGDTYNTFNNGVKTDSLTLAKGEIGKTFINPEPRISFSYQINDKSSLKGGYARNTQNLHLLSNSTTASPTDSWIGNSYNIKPEIADQISVGYFRNFKDNSYEFSAETYYKNMQNQVDYKNGADLNSTPDVESELLYGIGRAYGLELLFKKKKGKFTGWVSYTLSRTERKIDGINRNEWYVAKQDRTHDLAIVAMYDINKRWSFATNFILYTGNAVTYPTGKYMVQGTIQNAYASRNGNRFPTYHRLDFSFNYEGKKTKKWEGSWNIGLYNAYGRQNPFIIEFKEDPNDASKTQTVKTSLFRWVPSITYNFKF